VNLLHFSFHVSFYMYFVSWKVLENIEVYIQENCIFKLSPLFSFLNTSSLTVKTYNNLNILFLAVYTTIRSRPHWPLSCICLRPTDIWKENTRCKAQQFLMATWHKAKFSLVEDTKCSFIYEYLSFWWWIKLTTYIKEPYFCTCLPDNKVLLYTNKINYHINLYSRKNNVTNSFFMQ
jgi:hypothetical protein